MATKRNNVSKKSAYRKSEKMPRNGKSVFLTLLMVFALVFCAGGFFTFTQVTKNDEFVLIGEKSITLTVGDKYNEQGARVISFGKDKSEEIIIDSSNVDTSAEGKYFVKYTTTAYRFKKVVRYRYVIVKEETV